MPALQHLHNGLRISCPHFPCWQNTPTKADGCDTPFSLPDPFLITGWWWWSLKQDKSLKYILPGWHFFIFFSFTVKVMPVSLAINNCRLGSRFFFFLGGGGRNWLHIICHFPITHCVCYEIQCTSPCWQIIFIFEGHLSYKSWNICIWFEDWANMAASI